MDADGTEAAIRLILETCPNLQSLVISVGHNAAGFGSRIERLLRSVDLSDAIRRINDDRIHLNIAQFMFGASNRTPMQDVVACMKESWLYRVESSSNCDGNEARSGK